MMRRIPMFLVLGALGCSDAPEAYDREGLLRDIAQGLMIPGYEVLDQRVEALVTAHEALCQTPSAASLEATRQAWRAARVAHEATEGWRIGPYDSGRVDAALDRWPTKTADIESLIEGEVTLDAAHFEALGANKKGLPALEYLLWSGTSEAVVQALGEERRCAYSLGLTREARRTTQALVGAWSGGYLDGEFVGKGEMFMTSQAVVSALVNAMIAETEEVANTQLGKPLGTSSGGVAQPELAETWRSGHALEDAVENLRSLRAVYVGEDGKRGVSDYVRARKVAVDALLLPLFDDAIAKTEAIQGPLSEAVAQRPEQVTEAREATLVLLRALKVELTASLGVVLTFNDNDGD